MIELSLADVAAATAGELNCVPEATDRVTGPVVVDSRQVAPGALFVALPGERADGHDYAAAAVAAGAVAVLAGRPIGQPAVVVGDVLVALGRLTRYVADRLTAATVVGVTGSSGKTSTKDLLAHLLAERGPTVAPPGSYNNEIGVPLTVLRADRSTAHLVLELGARGAGHIAALCALAPPRIGVVLNVGAAHLGEFGSKDAVARAKGELVEALPPEGLAVLNAADPLVAAMAARTSARIATFAVEVAATSAARGSADVVARSVSLDPRGRPSFVLVAPAGEAAVHLPLYGAHHVPNALAAACVAGELGMPVAEVAAALAEAVPASRWRMEVVERADGVTVINDAYNANPDSVRAALEALVAMAGGRRSWAVLGEMRELGAAAAEEHEAVGRLAVRLGVSRLVAIGDAAARVHTAATQENSPVESAMVPDADSALALLRAEVAPGDVVLVKASRAAGLERVGESLLAMTAPASGSGGFS
ncbi:UDP-N-acetylmuramoyl-tripeptide--D-alanyl-D-alanine ligase [soil metagenome]